MKLSKTRLTAAHWDWMASARTEDGTVVWAEELPTEPQVDAAQKRLGCTFDPAYVRFLREFGGALIGADPLYGLYVASAMGDDEDVVSATLHFRSDKGLRVDDWYVVSNDGRGGPIGVAPDGRVRLSDHGEVVPVADSFPTYLAQRIHKADYDRRNR